MFFITESTLSIFITSTVFGVSTLGGSIDEVGVDEFFTNGAGSVYVLWFVTFCGVEVVLVSTSGVVVGVDAQFVGGRDIPQVFVEVHSSTSTGATGVSHQTGVGDWELSKLGVWTSSWIGVLALLHETKVKVQQSIKKRKRDLFIGIYVKKYLHKYK